MMPIFEHACRRCGAITEDIRPMRLWDLDTIDCEDCGGPAERIISVPVAQVWNAERRFPNLSPHGDGTKTFPSQKAYEGFLKEKGWGEVSTGGRLKRPHSAKVTTYDS